MIKKVKYVLLAFACFAVMLFVPTLVAVNQTAYCVNGQTISQTNDQIAEQIISELEDFIEFGQIQKDRASRIPGSTAEYNSAMYIKQELSKLTNFEPVNNASTEDGVQRFFFTSVYDGLSYASQNIVFKRTTKTNSNKKIILSAHYDTTYVYNSASSDSGLVADGINDNAGSVAVLLAMAKYLDSLDIDPGYTVELVFFGASTNDYDGASFYNRGLDESDFKSILLVMNLDKISVGRYNYMYVNEFITSQQKYIQGILEDEFNFKRLKNINCLDLSTTSPNGLSYTHIGLESDHAIFMKNNVNVLNFFSGDYESVITFGNSEYNTGNNVTFTENDSYEYITQNFPEFKDNLVNVYNAIKSLMWDADFVAEMEKDNGLEARYSFWTNEKLAVFITAILLVVFVFIYYLIYMGLAKKSRARVSGGDVEKIVIKISTNLGEDNSDINNIIDQKIKSDTQDKDNKEDKEE